MSYFCRGALLAATLAGLPAVAATSAPPRPAQRPAPPTPRWRDRLTGQRYALPRVIGGRPVAFYLTSPRVSPLAKALYRGHFRPSDTDSTSRLLALATTPDPVIRPFYRWCLDFTILLSDGALGEYPGQPALAYATKFPREFFAYMAKDASGQRYQRWVAIMAYSGLNDYAQLSPAVEQAIASRMTKNCKECSPALTKRIRKLAGDVLLAAAGSK